MKELVAIADKIAAKLIERRQTIAVAESSTGGLISAALLAVPGASAYFLGGGVIYTREARRILMDIPDDAMKGIRSASEPYAQLLASQIRRRFSTDWGLSETGATGPTGNRYGDAAGHACIAIAGPIEKSTTLETRLLCGCRMQQSRSGKASASTSSRVMDTPLATLSMCHSSTNPSRSVSSACARVNKARASLPQPAAFGGG